MKSRNERDLSANASICIEPTHNAFNNRLAGLLSHVSRGDVQRASARVRVRVGVVRNQVSALSSHVMGLYECKQLSYHTVLYIRLIHFVLALWSAATCSYGLKS